MHRLIKSPHRHPQLVQDLQRFPEPVLNLLANDSVAIYVIGGGESLADTCALRTLTDAEYEAAIATANGLVAAILRESGPSPEDEFQAAMAEAALRHRLREDLRDQLREAGLEFPLARSSQPLSLELLASNRSVPEARRQDWIAAFVRLNQGLVEHGHPRHELLLLPYNYYADRPVSEARLRDAHTVTAQRLEKALGVHRGEQREVVLHERYLPNPAPELGDYRVAIHELAHALDHALEDLDGHGQAHRKRMHVLYQNDRLRPEQFMSGRAKDHVREYFAEAVEAYLSETRREPLREKNPDLYSYIEEILRTPFAADALPEHKPPWRPTPITDESLRIETLG